MDDIGEVALQTYPLYFYLLMDEIGEVALQTYQLYFDLLMDDIGWHVWSNKLFLPASANASRCKIPTVRGTKPTVGVRLPAALGGQTRSSSCRASQPGRTRRAPTRAQSTPRRGTATPAPRAPHRAVTNTGPTRGKPVRKRIVTVVWSTYHRSRIQVNFVEKLGIPVDCW